MTYDIVLNCLHIVTYQLPPKLGTEVWCVKCDKYVLASVYTYYKVGYKCRKCPTCRYYGTDETTAKRKAVEHAYRTGHDVDLVKTTDI